MRIKCMLITSIALVVATGCQKSSDYFADPSAHVFDDQLYIYPSHDIDSGVYPDGIGSHYDMKDYHVLSLDQEGQLIDQGVALKLEEIPWAKKQLWAPDIAFKDGTYFFYFPAKDNAGTFRIGVATGQSPTGPFVSEEHPVEGLYSIDPAVFVDENEEAYIYFGGIGGGQLQGYQEGAYDSKAQAPSADEPALGPMVAQLNQDMISLADSPSEIQILDKDGKPLLAKDEDKRFFEAAFMHKYQDTYYLSYSTGTTHKVVYATSDHPMGPFTFQGTILEPVEGWTTHHSIVEYHGEWYLFYHDAKKSGKDHLRNVKYKKLYYGEDGSIQTKESVSKSATNKQEAQSQNVEAYLHANGSILEQNNEPVILKAINFDNLTWFSENGKLDDGTYVFSLHHNETDYDTVKEMGFNSIRYFIRWQDLFQNAETLKKNEAGWEWLNQNIQWAKERNISLILDFHCPKGGFGTKGSGAWPIWKKEKLQKAYIEAWQEIAQTYNDEVTIAGYDLMNEPSLARNGIEQYQQIMQDTVDAIREVDGNHIIIVESAVGVDGDMESYEKPTWVQVKDDNLMYSFHFYDPLSFTHNDPSLDSKLIYPNKEYTKEVLAKKFEQCINEPFLMENPILLGEFGCNDWSEDSGAMQWIQDVYELCEQKNVHTALFAYRSFEDYKEKDNFSFGISRMYYNAESKSGIVEEKNEELVEFLMNEWTP